MQLVRYYSNFYVLPAPAVKIPYTKEGVELLHILPYIILSGQRCVVKRFMNEMQCSQTVKSLFVMQSSGQPVKMVGVRNFDNRQSRDRSIYGSDHPLVVGMLIERSQQQETLHCRLPQGNSLCSSWWFLVPPQTYTHTSYTSSQWLVVAAHQEGTGSAPHSSRLCAPLLPLPCSHHACLWVGEAVHLPPHEQIPAVFVPRQREPDLVMNIHIEVGLGYEFLEIMWCLFVFSRSRSWLAL